MHHVLNSWDQRVYYENKKTDSELAFISHKVCELALHGLWLKTNSELAFISHKVCELALHGLWLLVVIHSFHEWRRCICTDNIFLVIQACQLISTEQETHFDPFTHSSISFQLSPI